MLTSVTRRAIMLVNSAVAVACCSVIVEEPQKQTDPYGNVAPENLP